MHTFAPAKKAFTLVELMVSTAIIGLIMIVLVTMTNQTSQTWRSTTEKIEKFQEARDGFESMTRRLAQATLNTNWDYLGTDVSDPNPSFPVPRDKTVNSADFNSFVPFTYGRTSDLRIASGPMTGGKGTALATDKTRATHGIFFQAPFGTVSTPNYDIMNNLLNTWGYYLEEGKDQTVPTFVSNLGTTIVKTRYRSRLMEFRQPSEQMMLYDPTNKKPNFDWFQKALANNPPSRVLAENIIALVLMPRLSPADENTRLQKGDFTMLSPYYCYDSQQTLNPGVPVGTPDAGGLNPKNQLPPIVEVTMVALDERSAKKLAERYGGGTGDPGPYMGLDKSTGSGTSFTALFQDQTKNPLEGPGGDLDKLEKLLVFEKLTYRVFTTNVTIRGAKWSRVQTQ